MGLSLDKFSAGTVDWRAEIRKNQQRTFMIIAIFLGIYISLGLLVDIFIAAGKYPNASFGDLVKGIATLQIFPIATAVMFAVAALSLLVTISMSHQLMLLGTEYREITPETAQNEQEKQLYNIIEELKIAAGMQYMPKVYIIDADYMNAFASGFTEKSAMVAITRGLMTKLNRAEIQAVMAHEMSHVRHLDIKVTLMASVLTNLILMVLDMFFYSAIYGGNDSRESDTRSALVPVILILRWVLPIINILLMLYLSRTREYMADAGCVELTRDKQGILAWCDDTQL